VANGVGLGGTATAVDTYYGIELPAGLGHFKRLQDSHPGRIPGEIGFEGTPIYRDLPGARDQPYAGNSGLAAPSPSNSVFTFCHRDDVFFALIRPQPRTDQDGLVLAPLITTSHIQFEAVSVAHREIA